MFCLRSWLPLLFIPTNASPTFIFLFFVCTYFLNRPCVYCSFLLLILFLTSCNWSDRCFFDFGSNWFEPRITSFLPSPELLSNSVSSSSMLAASLAKGRVNETVAAIAGALNNTVAATIARTLDSFNGFSGFNESCSSSLSSSASASSSSSSYVTSAAAVASEAVQRLAGAAAAVAANATAGAGAGAGVTPTEWTGIGMEWLRSLLGRREWRIDCLDMNVRL